MYPPVCSLGFGAAWDRSRQVIGGHGEGSRTSLARIGGRSRRTALQSLTTPNEKAWYTSLLAKMHGLTPFEREQFIASKVDLARDLDAGGRLVPERQLLKNQTALKASYLQTEKDVLASSVKSYIKTPGLDDKSAQHVCTANVDLLTELPLRRLARGGAVNIGRRITMRALENPCYSSSIQALVRDVEGAVIKLALYNFLPATARCLDAERVIPPGCTIVIKEPYVKCQLDGTIGIRVDNPCNVVITRLAPPSEGADAPAMRKHGNTLFQLCEFERAADAYGVALSLEPATEIAVACLSNRAAALLRLNRFSEALNDCVAARTFQPEHVKAIFRSGQALFQLRRYVEPCAAYELALKSGPSSAIASELQRAYNAARGVTGHFDQASLRDSVDLYAGPSKCVLLETRDVASLSPAMSKLVT